MVLPDRIGVSSMVRKRRWILASSVAAAMLSGQVLAEAPPTVWHALGIPQTYLHLRDGVNVLGKHPGLERKPPLKRIADPANLKSDVPAIKTAAEVKQQEDLAPQKIKAIKYLASIGCGCYGGVAEALQAALEDCTEAVRYEAAMALISAMNNHCETCNGTCCTPELAAKMYERAYGTDASGCNIEPSARVRAALAQAVAACPPNMLDVELPPDDRRVLPDPDPDTTRIPTPPPDRPIPPPPIGQGAQRAAPKKQQPVTSSRKAWKNAQVSANLTDEVDSQLKEQPVFEAPQAPQMVWTTKLVHGSIVESKNQRGYVRVAFEDGHKPAVGTELKVFHQYVLGTEFMGTIAIAGYEGNLAIASPKAWDKTKVVFGDSVECMIRVAAPAPAAEPKPAPVVDKEFYEAGDPLVAPVIVAGGEVDTKRRSVHSLSSSRRNAP
jgi:hypothetical protein